MQIMGSVIADHLKNFWQRSDFSDGHATSQYFIASSILDENGKILSMVKVTEVVAESYAAAAQFHLYCRLLRLSWTIDVKSTHMLTLGIENH